MSDTMEKLEQAAIKENWDYVDTWVPKICNDSTIVGRAIQLLKDTDKNLRDLGATILEQTKGITDETKTDLYRLMENQTGYDSFRAACALAKHGEKD